MIPADIPFQMYRIWTHPRAKDSLTDIHTWTYGQIMKANEWLDIIDDAERRQQEKQRREMETQRK